MNLLADEQASGSTDTDLIWVLDTDIFILKPNTLTDASEALAGWYGVLAGEPDSGHEGDPKIIYERVAVNTLLFVPGAVWHPRCRPFLEDGEPSRQFQDDVLSEGHFVVSFPFRSRRYVLHLGRGTLNVVAHSGESENSYYDWATTHSDPHYAGDPQGAAWVAAFDHVFRSAVPSGSDDELAHVLSRGERFEIGPP